MTEDFRPVTEQISEISTRYPDWVALSASERQMSYQDLDLRADRLAGYLTQFGVGPGGSVAICMERSFDWVVAALGIMRAGAAYIPLDPAWPDARLRFAIDNSGATVLLRPRNLLDRLMVKARGIDLRRDAAAIATSAAVKPTPVSPESLAYVIHTSGSTGSPKGVEITHSNLAHLIRWHRDTFGVTQQDRASHLAGLGFRRGCLGAMAQSLRWGDCMPGTDDSVRSSPTATAMDDTRTRDDQLRSHSPRRSHDGNALAGCYRAAFYAHRGRRAASGPALPLPRRSQ